MRTDTNVRIYQIGRQRWRWVVTPMRVVGNTVVPDTDRAIVGESPTRLAAWFRADSTRRRFR